MLLLIVTTLVSFFISNNVLPLVIKLADAKKVFDLPGNRKVHFIPVPSLGGVAIFGGIFITLVAMALLKSSSHLTVFIGASSVIFLVGFLDDVFMISPQLKLFGQLIAASIIIHVGHVQLTSFHGFLGITDLNPLIAILFSFLTILTIVNAFNLIDGIDGLAGTIGIISALFFGLVFLIEKDYLYSTISFSMAASLLAFLRYNYSPARIFMGDTGSLFIGFVNAVLVIRFINAESLPLTMLKFSAAPAIGFAVLFVPLMDTLRIFIKRVFSGRSPFESDVNHIHHLMLDKGFSHLQISFILGILSMVFIVFAILFQPLGINFIIAGIFAIGTVFVVYIESIPFPSVNEGKMKESVEIQTTNQPKIIIKEIPETPELKN